MEASEAAETTQAPEEAQTTEGAESTEEAPQAPDVGEALQQMNSRFDAIEERLPQAEESPDLLSALTAPLSDDAYGEGEEQAQQQQEQGEGEEPDLRQLLGEVVDERFQGWQLQQEATRR